MFSRPAINSLTQQTDVHESLNEFQGYMELQCYVMQVHEIVCDYFRKCTSHDEFLLSSSRSAIIQSQHSIQGAVIDDYIAIAECV